MAGKLNHVQFNLHQETQVARDLLAGIADIDPDLRHDLVEGETGLFEAIDKAVAVIDECEIVATGCRAKEQEIASRRQAAEARKERTRGLIEQALFMAGLDGEPIKRPTATLTVAQRPAKAVVTDEAKIPSKFWKQPDPVLDKAALNKAVKGGEAVPGVEKSNGGTSLTIRRL